MAEKIRCDCGITFIPEEGQAHCNYCGIKLVDIGKQTKTKEKKRQGVFTNFNWLAWWQLDQNELQRQVKEYKGKIETAKRKGGQEAKKMRK